MVNDLVYLRDPALAGFRRFTLVVDFAKIKKENKFRNSSDFLGNQILATLSAKSARVSAGDAQTVRQSQALDLFGQCCAPDLKERRRLGNSSIAIGQRLADQCRLCHLQVILQVNAAFRDNRRGIVLVSDRLVYRNADTAISGCVAEFVGQIFDVGRTIRVDDGKTLNEIS
jgi:hypothetical protein